MHCIIVTLACIAEHQMNSSIACGEWRYPVPGITFFLNVLLQFYYLWIFIFSINTVARDRLLLLLF